MTYTEKEIKEAFDSYHSTLLSFPSEQDWLNFKEYLPEKKDNIKQREDKFIKEVHTHKKYSVEMRESFIRCWTELNRSGKKMRFEMQETFQISKRLATFFRNSKRFNNDRETTSDIFERKRRERRERGIV